MLLESGFSDNEIKKIANDKAITIIAIDKPLKNDELIRLEKYVFSTRNDISFNIYGHYNAHEICDLEILDLIPSLRHFSVNVYEGFNIKNVIKLKNLESLSICIYNLDSFDFLENINSGLKNLSLGQTKSKKPALNFLERFDKLEILFLEGHKQSIEDIKNLKQLQRIILRSITLDNINFLKDLKNLWSVDIKLGGIKNLDELKYVENLKYLELWQVKGLADLSFISKLSTIQNLFLQSLKQVEILPDFSRCENLRRIYLENMIGLKNISNLQFAPSLEDFQFVSAENFNPEDLIPVLKNSNLKNISAGFGSLKKNNQFLELIEKYKKGNIPNSKFEYI